MDGCVPHRRRTAARESARIHAPQRGQPAKTTAGREDLGGRFFQGCLAKSRSSTPEARYHWREGIYGQIRGVMSMQGSLSIERMCQLAGVSWAGFYRSLQEELPTEAAKLGFQIVEAAAA